MPSCSSFGVVFRLLGSSDGFLLVGSSAFVVVRCGLMMVHWEDRRVSRACVGPLLVERSAGGVSRWGTCEEEPRLVGDWCPALGEHLRSGVREVAGVFLTVHVAPRDPLPATRENRFVPRKRTGVCSNVGVHGYPRGGRGSGAQREQSREGKRLLRMTSPTSPSSRSLRFSSPT